MPSTAGPTTYSIGGTVPPVWGRPDPALAAAGIEGEFVVARVRLFAMGLLLIAPPWNISRRTGFAVTLAASITALAIYLVGLER
jgi:hypothetical protein